jgi:hypothetical protein
MYFTNVQKDTSDAKSSNLTCFELGDKFYLDIPPSAEIAILVYMNDERFVFDNGKTLQRNQHMECYYLLPRKMRRANE